MFPFIHNQAPNSTWSNVNPPQVAHNSPLPSNLNVSVKILSKYIILTIYYVTMILSILI